ncbi:MAG: CvpA family protein [Clostridia bacterium]|nr:CvpA family protein [Clostridia bacterium]
MAIIVDLVIVAVLVIFVIVGVKRGFVLTLLPVISIVVAILLGIALKGPVRSLLDKTQLEQKIKVSVTNIAQKALDKIEPTKEAEAEGGEADQSAQDGEEGQSEESKQIEENKEEATHASAIPKYISDTVKGWLAQAGENMFGEKTDTAERLGTKAASLIMDLIAFLIIAVIAIIIMVIVKVIVKRTRELNIPVLHQLDSVGGGILGFVLGAAILYGIAFVLGILASCGYLTSFADLVKRSLLGSFIYNRNLIGAIIAAIKGN